eukprot:556019-Prymnesium_polylepis.3
MAHMWTEMGLDGDPAAAVQDGLEVAAPAPSGKLTMAPVGQLAGSSSSRPPATSTMAPVGSKPVTPAPASSLADSGRSAASSGGSLSFNPGVRPGTPAETYSAIIEDSLREIATLSASPACAATCQLGREDLAHDTGRAAGVCQRGQLEWEDLARDAGRDAS